MVADRAQKDAILSWSYDLGLEGGIRGSADPSQLYGRPE